MAPVSSFVRSTLSHAYSTVGTPEAPPQTLPRSLTIANVLGMAKHATQPAANKNENRLAGVLNMMLGRPPQEPHVGPLGSELHDQGHNMCRL